MDSDDHPSQHHERFLREFIEIYKENSLLWDTNNPNHKNRDQRNIALGVLLDKCREYYPLTDAADVVHKINTIRSGFRRQYRQVLKSRKTAKSPDQVYKPSLWYYKQLLFLVGEKCETDDLDSPKKGYHFFQKVSCWTKEYTVLLIELFKNHEVLHPTALECNKAKREEAFKKITDELSATTGKKFRVPDVKKKIYMLRGQYRKQLILINKKPSFQKSWWFDLLHGVLAPYSNIELQTKEAEKELSNAESDSSKSNLDVEDEDDTPLSIIKEEFQTEKVYIANNAKLEEDYQDDYTNESANNNQDDENIGFYHTMSKMVADKLRSLKKSQRHHAERLINELMYHGLMEELNQETKLVL